MLEFYANSSHESLAAFDYDSQPFIPFEQDLFRASR